MILSREQRAEHPFAGHNTQQTLFIAVPDPTYFGFLHSFDLTVLPIVLDIVR